MLKPRTTARRVSSSSMRAMPSPPVGDGERQRVGDSAHVPQQPVGRLVAGGLADLLDEYRPIFDPMAVAIDDRMAEPGTDLFGMVFFTGAHALLREVIRYSAAILNPMS